MADIPSKPAVSREGRAAFALFGDLPTLYIVQALVDGPRRFAELAKLTGVNQVTLSVRLKRLTAQGIVTRYEQEADQQSVTYYLAALGVKMLPIIHQIEQFSKELPPELVTQIN